jgi:GNAT superfamily N-acetyltransferase
VRRLASARLARDARPVGMSLPDGTPLLVRPLLAEDRSGYGNEVQHLSLESRRRRFFSSAQPSQAMVDYLIDIDYVDHFAWLALDATHPDQGLATVRYVRSEQPDEAETAFGTVDRFQGRGIGTLLLGAIGVAAVEAGITKLVGHVLDDNAPMRAVFAKADSTSQFYEPGVLLVEVSSERAASLLPRGTRQQLTAAVHDIVTAASLALARNPAGGPVEP